MMVKCTYCLTSKINTIPNRRSLRFWVVRRSCIPILPMWIMNFVLQKPVFLLVLMDSIHFSYRIRRCYGVRCFTCSGGTSWTSGSYLEIRSKYNSILFKQAMIDKNMETFSLSCKMMFNHNELRPIVLDHFNVIDSLYTHWRKLDLEVYLRNSSQ